MVQSEAHRPIKTYRGTVDEVFSHRNEIPPGATLELNVFEATPKVPATKDAHRIAPEAASKAKQLRGRGMLAGILSSEAFLRRKHEETLLEDRRIR